MKSTPPRATSYDEVIDPASERPRMFENRALFTDLYELTMAQAYFSAGMADRAAFELFYRELPGDRNFALFCGLEDVLSYLDAVRFRAEDIDYLRSLDKFSDDFLDYLSDFRFTGDVHAMPEGTLAFPHEPVLRIEAPIIEAQILETWVLNQVHAQTVLASKAARVIHAADGRPVADFGSRRTHGADAALKLARATWIAGAAGSSNLEAGRLYGVPVLGTMAHSFVQAFDDEPAAFRAFMREYPETTLLVDTYDTVEGVRRMVSLAEELGEDFRVRAVRLDSGDFIELSRKTRELLDEGGLENVGIMASSGLDEYRIDDIVRAGAPIDGFGVGTRWAVSHDAPDLDFAYKLVEYAGTPRMKTSSRKMSLPGRKQVFRRTADDGRLAGDTIARHDEACEGRPLLERFMRHGRRAAEPETTRRVRERARMELDSLPEAYRALTKADTPYRVDISRGLERERENLLRRLAS